MRKIVVTMLMAVVTTTASATDISTSSHQYPIPKGINIDDIHISDNESIDPTSYAMGANIGLGVSLAYISRGVDIDPDITRYHMLSVYASREVDEQQRALCSKMMSEFHNKRMAPYLQAKASGTSTLPSLFDDVYTKEKVSMGMGYVMGCSLVEAHFKFDIASVICGYDDALMVHSDSEIDSKMRIPMSEMSALLRQMQQVEEEAARAKQEELKAENARLSAEWLADIEKQEGVIKCESGLLYRVERKGTGAYPTNNADKVQVHYRGTLRNGETFDSSYERGEPLIFGLHQVIKGWGEGLKHINEGGKITLWIPAHLAYGANGAGGVIGPNEALKFEIELIEVMR